MKITSGSGLCIIMVVIYCYLEQHTGKVLHLLNLVLYENLRKPLKFNINISIKEEIKAEHFPSRDEVFIRKVLSRLYMRIYKIDNA